jgi:hypothetical protein
VDEKYGVGQGKSGTELLADLSKKSRKGAELICFLPFWQTIVTSH